MMISTGRIVSRGRIMNDRDDCTDLPDSYFNHPFSWVKEPIHPFAFVFNPWTYIIGGMLIVLGAIAFALR